jgi:hypothetical protein
MKHLRVSYTLVKLLEIREKIVGSCLFEQIVYFGAFLAFCFGSGTPPSGRNENS